MKNPSHDIVGREFLTYTIEQLIPLLRARKLSPVEVTQACLDRIEALNGTLCTYTLVLAEQALEQAREAMHALARSGPRSLLHGVPVSVKDVLETKGIPTTWGEKDLAEYRPSDDSTLVVKLREAGAIVLGKTNVDVYPHPEGARLIGPTRNPWDPKYLAGWSSGGSGAAVAALLDYSSIGTDTGGSIRIPAALCGVVGLKPTYGLVSKYRVFPYSNSFDHCGPLSRSVYDCALLLGIIAGHDPKDPTTVDRPVPDYTRGLGESVRGLRVGLPRGPFLEGDDPEVTRLVEEAVVVLGELGMEINAIDLPYFFDTWVVEVVSALETTAMAEAMGRPVRPSDLYVAHILGRGMAARRRILHRAISIREAAEHRYAEIFRHIDLIVMPTVPTTATGITEVSGKQRSDRLSFELELNTRIFSFIRYPAISIPCGFATDGMPVGLQIAGRPFEEELLLRAAHAYERATGWYRLHPVLL